MIVVVDASVVAKWFIAEDNATDALELLGKNYELLISGKLYILDLLSGWPVHNPEINTETIITIIGFLGAILLLLDVVIIN